MLEIVLTSFEYDQYSSAPKDINKISIDVYDGLFL